MPCGADRSHVQTDIVLRETGTGNERLHIAMKEGQLTQVTFSPDGRLLASVCLAETIRLWDTWTGKEVGHLTGHRGQLRSWFWHSLSFAPDGKTLASGGFDGTVLIWDVSGLLPMAKKPVEKLSSDKLAKCWDELAGTDAVRAYKTIAELAQRPGQAEDLLKDKLAAHPGLNADRQAKLIADLDADQFTTREKASKELADLGRLADGALAKALEGMPSAEVKRRVQALLQKLDGKAADPEQSRLLRAIEVLERLGTPEARDLHGKLAKESTAGVVAWEAKASLERLGKAKRAP